VSSNSKCSILPADLRFVMGQVLASGREVFVDRCEMIFQRLVKICSHLVEQFGFLRLKLCDALPHQSDAARVADSTHHRSATCRKGQKEDKHVIIR